MQSSILKRHKIQYHQIRNQYVLKGKFKEIDLKKLNKTINGIKEDIMFADKKNDVEASEQLYFYKTKFEDLEKLLKENKKKLNTNFVQNQAKKIFSSQRYESQRREQHMKSLQKSKKQLSSFFSKKKESSLASSFDSLLQHPKTSMSRSFRKKIQNNNVQIQRLKRENAQIQNKIKYMLTMKVVGLSEQQRISQIQQRIIELQQENQRLYQQNTQIKTQHTSSNNSRPTISSVEEVITSPYSLQTKQNNLGKIQRRNYINSPLISNNDKFLDNFNNRDYNNDKESLYNMSECSQSPAMLNSYHLGIQNKKVASRNKVAFFRDNGVILRDNSIDIAYKKLYLGQDIDKVVLNIYIQNKTSETKATTIQYDYERNYYKLKNQKQIFSIQPFKQKREVIQISLDNKKNDINSICEGVIHFGGANYKFWIPVLFILFKSYSQNGNFSFKQAFSKNAVKQIQVNQSFSSPQSMQKYVPVLEYDGSEGVIWGISRVYQGPINLKWKKHKKVQIKTSAKWIDAVAFALLDYQ